MVRVADSRVEQLVARRAHNPEVGGSSPSPVMFFIFWIWFLTFYIGFDVSSILILFIHESLSF